MKKKVLALLFIVFISCSEKKLIIDKNEIDLGKLKPFEKKEVVVLLKNKSNSSINIQSIKTSCSCIVNSDSKIKLNPKSEFKLKLLYSSKEIGTFLETIVINNDTDEPFKVIKIKAIVK